LQKVQKQNIINNHV